MKAEGASIWKSSHEKMVAVIDAEVNPEKQIGDHKFLSEILASYFYGNIYPEELSQIEKHAEHVKVLQPIIDSITERVADLDYYRNLLQEYRIESTGVLGFVERISFELQKRKKYERIKEQYIQAHKDLLKLRIHFNKQVAQTPELSKTHISSEKGSEGGNLTADEMYTALFKNPVEDLEIEQRRGNCYWVATLLSLQSKPGLAKEVLGSMVNEVQSGVFEVNFPGLPENIDVTTHDILRYAAAGKIARTNNLGNTILEVAFNEYLERVSTGFFHDDMELGPRRFTELKNATGGESVEVIGALLGKEMVESTFLFEHKDTAWEYLSNLDPERTIVTFGSHQSIQFVSALRKKAAVAELTRSEQSVLNNPSPMFYPVVDFEGNERALLGEHAYAMIGIDQQNQTIILQNPAQQDDVVTLNFSTAIESFLTMSYATVPQTKQQ